MQEKFLKYKSARNLHSNVLKVLYEYYEENEYFFNNQVRDFLNGRSKKDIESIRMENLVLEGEDAFNHISMFIYPDKFLKKSVSEVAKEKHFFRKFEELEMLNSILNADFGIYKPLSYDYINKTVELINVITREKVEIIDERLVKGINNIKDLGFYLVTRVIKYKSISFLTNATVLVQDDESNEYIEKVKENNLNSMDIYVYAILYKNKFKK